MAQFSSVSLALVNMGRIMSDLSDDSACLSRPGEIVDDDSVVEVEVPVVDEALEPVRKTGRSQSMVWGYFTNVVQPQKLKAVVCKHCRHLINHHEKSESAINHLNACSEFRHVMNGLEISERPDWYVSNKKTGVHAAQCC